MHGVAGLGASSVIHTSSLVELSSGLPVVIEVVDDEAHVEKPDLAIIIEYDNFKDVDSC
jgi:PII-like signaling protein